MMARPGSKEYGRLGMVAGFFCQIEILESVPRTAFRPVPEVDSAIVRLRPQSAKARSRSSSLYETGRGALQK